MNNGTDDKSARVPRTIRRIQYNAVDELFLDRKELLSAGRNKSVYCCNLSTAAASMLFDPTENLHNYTFKFVYFFTQPPETHVIKGIVSRNEYFLKAFNNK